MDATILTVLGTGLTAIGTGVALFVALWRVQGNRFDAVDRRFDAVEKLNRERFEMAEKLNRERFEAMDRRFDMAQNTNRERFETAENANRERFETAESANRERFGAMDRRFDMAEQRNQAAHAAICDAIGKVDRRLDDLYRICSTRGRRPGRPAPPPPRGSRRRSRWHAGCVHPRYPLARGAGGHGDRLGG